jgi:EAL domain-containing protein (putative c-di-GMP-specific phosphodiesterase class I)
VTGAAARGDQRAPARPYVRRGGWALPPAPPETWVGGAFTAALLVGLLACVVVPGAGLLRDDITASLPLAATHALAGVATALTSYLLLVAASVTGDVRLRWVAGGYGLLLGVVLLHAATVLGAGADPDGDGTDRGAALGVAWGLALPLLVLTAGVAVRSLRWFVLPALLLVGLVATAALWTDPLPGLVVDGLATTALRGAEAAVAVLALAAAVRWWRESPLGVYGPWGLVLGGLALAPLGAALRAGSMERYDGLWWSALGVDVAALAVPAVGLVAQGTSGYFRQARRWHQLEAEVRELRTATALLPGRSVTPDDDAGLPEAREVRDLIAAARVKIALQPVVELATGAVVGHEALSRFGGRVPTDRWFRAAGRHGLGAELERLTLRAALALLPQLPAPGFLAVNVSPAALTDPEVLALLYDSDLSRVVVEITEHEAVADYPEARATLDRLRRFGARIAVDDTGAGFASLRHVLLLQPEVIKLDTSITRDVDTDARQQALVVALMSFAGEVGSEVLAEGVETEEQLQALMAIGVPVGQGWHLGLPVIQE